MSGQRQERLFSLGWKIMFCGGFFPMIVGGMDYAQLMKFLSAHSAEEWYLMRGIPSAMMACLSDSTNHYLGHFVLKETLVKSVNLMATGFVLTTISYFWLRKYADKAAWCIIAILCFWVAGNDTLGLIFRSINSTGTFPTPVIPLTLGILGLALTFPKVFSNGK